VRRIRGYRIGPGHEASSQATKGLANKLSTPPPRTFANLVFAHRDADATDEAPRVDEIKTALRPAVHTVPVVPVRETEAGCCLTRALSATL